MEEARKDDESEAEYSKRILEDALINALAKVHVNIPKYVKAALEKFSGAVTFADGDTRKPMMGDNDLTTAIAEWAKTEDAKHYISASINSGGGATGGARGWPDDRQTRADWDLWEFMPHCLYWQAVALSLDLEPPTNESSVRGWPPEYERRRKIAAAHMECKNLQRSKADHGYGTVDLPAFSAWAQSLGWSLPDRFPRTVAKEAAAPAAQDQMPTGTAPVIMDDEVERHKCDESAKAVWQQLAKDAADSIYMRGKKIGCDPSISDIAKEIEKEFAGKVFTVNDKRLNAGYIKRHGLEGWVRPKT